MSGFYDDGGVDFAKEQFDNARIRKDKEAKKQDKFSQKLLLADLAVKGFNMSLNNKAEKLEQEALFEMSNYTSEIDSSNSFLNSLNAEKEKGYNNEEILYNRTLEQYKSFFPEGYSVDGIEGLAHDFVKERLEAWEDVIKHHEKVAGITPEELRAYIKTGVKAPRNIGEFLGNRLKKVFMSHTDETLKDKDAKIRNQEINKIELLGFGGLKDSLEKYNGVSSITALRKAIEKNPEKYRPYKMIGEGTYIKDSMQDGTIRPSMIFTKQFAGSGDEAYAFDQVFLPESLSQSVTDNRTENEKEYAIETTSYKVFDIINKSTYAENLSPDIKDFFEVLEDPENDDYNLNTYRSTMLDIDSGTKHILKKHRNIVMDETLATEIATINYHINRTSNNSTSTKPSLYSVETILAEKNGVEPDLSNLQNWINDLKDTSNYTKSESHMFRLEMIKELPFYITDDNDRKYVNDILSQNNFPSLEDIEGDVKEGFINSWDTLNKVEKKEYKNNRDFVFSEIENKLEDEINFTYNGVADIINETSSFYNTTLKPYFNNLTSDEQQQYGGKIPRTGSLANAEEKENYKKLVSDFKVYFMEKVKDLNISEGDFNASFYINNYKILN